MCVLLYMKSCILLAGTGVRKNITLACGFSLIKIHYSDYPKRFINRINEVDVFISIITTVIKFIEIR